VELWDLRMTLDWGATVHMSSWSEMSTGGMGGLGGGGCMLASPLLLCRPCPGELVLATLGLGYLGVMARANSRASRCASG
jgi:hypothetical protein